MGTRGQKGWIERRRSRRAGLISLVWIEYRRWTAKESRTEVRKEGRERGGVVRSDAGAKERERVVTSGSERRSRPQTTRIPSLSSDSGYPKGGRCVTCRDMLSVVVRHASRGHQPSWHRPHPDFLATASVLPL